MTARILSVVLAILSILALSYVFIPSRVEVTPGRVTLFHLAATYTGVDPDALKSVTLLYLLDGKVELSGRYVEYMARRKGIEVTLESSSVLVEVLKPELPVLEEGTQTSTPTPVLLAASEVVNLVATDMGIPSTCVEATVLEYRGKVVEDVEPRITYVRTPDGIVSAFLRYSSSNRILGYLSLRMEMSCMRKLVVSRRRIRLGETIEPDDVAEEVLDVFKLSGRHAPLDLVLYSVARRNINEGEVITLSMIKKKPDVYAGQILLAYVELPGIRVTAMVQALENAYVGDMIRVRNVSSGKVLTVILELGPVVRVLEVGR